MCLAAICVRITMHRSRRSWSGVGAVTPAMMRRVVRRMTRRVAVTPTGARVWVIVRVLRA